MNQHARLKALSSFLMAQRAKRTPEEAGLAPGPRRRTPGLRREEVAQLAGVSPTWYTWLEQGRDIKVSASVLEAVSSALRLDPDERKYLFALALETGAGTTALREETARINPPLRRILDELRTCPTIISDRHCHIVGWNEAAAHVFMDFELIPEQRRNMIALLFERKEFRRLAGNWEHFVSGFLAIFRAYYGQYVDDDWYDSFLRDMIAAYPDFNPLWEKSRVSAAPEVLIEFRHAKAGKMLFHLTSLQLQGNNDLRCSIYTPAPDSPTESKLKRLMDKEQQGHEPELP
ncbi:helix-turn-helix transcriptional regulator [Paenibacillus sacheonensis]|uniref:Helix-turn-helix domain-containing protein n=1 Tax=Paenibacillus sacheonensis TaxID=742054 RepID=A0A7X4YKK6_9BACL|nr:helix-turn-helix transcriptional regulator [Paenibacillus sacheonensis]MBM7563395.1 transcriptional regulator with XRE-family HTH domain [Paenibacillus sacheonensis]NBC68050.1 helix-turn-helix domain-containing protein [Paenibacillus sacheonensis]